MKKYQWCVNFVCVRCYQLFSATYSQTLYSFLATVFIKWVLLLLVFVTFYCSSAERCELISKANPPLYLFILGDEDVWFISPRWTSYSLGQLHPYWCAWLVGGPSLTLWEDAWGERRKMTCGSREFSEVEIKRCWKTTVPARKGALFFFCVLWLWSAPRGLG
jgi:hypothetical protein